MKVTLPVLSPDFIPCPATDLLFCSCSLHHPLGGDGSRSRAEGNLGAEGPREHLGHEMTSLRSNTKTQRHGGSGGGLKVLY